MRGQATYLVLGGGPVGLLLTHAIHRRGFQVLCIDAPSIKSKKYHVALWYLSLRFLLSLIPKERLAVVGSPLTYLCIKNLKTGRNSRLASYEIGENHLGMAFRVDALENLLRETLPSDLIVKDRIHTVIPKDGHVRLFGKATYEGKLAFLTYPDINLLPGLQSYVRPYRSQALTVDINVQNAEWHTAHELYLCGRGPLALLPTKTGNLNVTLVKGPEPACTEVDVRRELDPFLKKTPYGDYGIATKTLAQWPLIRYHAPSYAPYASLLLVGQAAHAFPPVGAQGLNASIGDVAWLDRHLPTLDPQTYEQARSRKIKILADFLELYAMGMRSPLSSGLFGIANALARTPFKSHLKSLGERVLG